MGRMTVQLSAVSRLLQDVRDQVLDLRNQIDTLDLTGGVQTLRAGSSRAGGLGRRRTSNPNGGGPIRPAFDPRRGDYRRSGSFQGNPTIVDVGSGPRDYRSGRGQVVATRDDATANEVKGLREDLRKRGGGSLL